jgi:hypothetical protein
VSAIPRSYVPARHRRIVEAHVSGQAAPDARPLALERNRVRLAAILEAQVLAGLVDMRSRPRELLGAVLRRGL